MANENIKKHVLMIMPSFPYPESGAEQADRAEGIRQLVRLGWQVVVIAKTVAWADHANIAARAQDMGVRAVLIPYRFSNRELSLGERVKKFFGKFRHPLYLDGAAYEFAEPAIRAAVAKELSESRPDAVWFEYTYLWPLYSLVRKAGIPIITRSINFEPEHFLQEDGYTLLNYIKFVPKCFSEWLTVRYSDVVLAITPKEEKIYRKLGAKKVRTLPLRSLPKFLSLPRPEIRTNTPLHVFFMGSSYAVSHNRAALRFILQKIAPEAERRAPGAFIFHILGSKAPQNLQALCDGKKIVHEGYVVDLDSFLTRMDIALVPSLMGAGQQQKIFEPLARGIPTITSTRAIAEYPYINGEHYLTARSTKEFVEALLLLQNASRRRALSDAASALSRESFSQEGLDAIVQDVLTTP